jgi:hypothetical protein
MVLSLRVVAIAGLMAGVASTSVMGQATGPVPSQPPSSEPTFPSQPPMTSPFSPNELIDTGNRFFGGVSHGFAMIVEKAVSQWGLPNGYVLGQEAGITHARRPKEHLIPKVRAMLDRVTRIASDLEGTVKAPGPCRARSIAHRRIVRNCSAYCDAGRRWRATPCVAIREDRGARLTFGRRPMRPRRRLSITHITL